ncbi:MAG: membrane protein insertion efficiency factor YidD [Beijerinckiaceae bacterium]|nr:membrane protein insertion efficiency factor YidD [Beijerinckiaceae bacterium]
MRQNLERRHHSALAWPRQFAHYAIRGYQVTLSGLMGRQCRHLPSCSSYTDEAIQRFGLWAGGWMGLARICRCQPWGTEGLDFVPETLPEGASWSRPWRFGLWRSTNPGPAIRCEAVDKGSPPRT